MKDISWTVEEILELSLDRERVLNKLLESFPRETNILFAAKLGFGVPAIDLVTVDKYRTVSGYVMKFPVVEGKINTLPYFQGFGEALFLTDQMVDNSYIIVPETEVSDNVAFTHSPDPLFRLRKKTFESGICVFDKNFRIKVKNEPKGSLSTHYWRLQIELLDSINSFGQIFIGDGKEGLYDEWVNWLKVEIAKLGDRKLLDENSAHSLVTKILEEKNYRSLNMGIKETQIDAKPRPIPAFEIKGKGLYLGDEKEFSMLLSRISGMIFKRDY
jgi:hypothetical protein